MSIHPRRSALAEKTAAIVIYTHPDCQGCDMVMDDLDRQGVPYKQIDVTATPGASRTRRFRRAVGADPRGYPRGGEDADYGNLLGNLGKFLRGIDTRFAVD